MTSNTTSIAERSSTLCRMCGLCCTDALHRHVTIEADERHRIANLGVSIEAVTDQARGFRLPCVLYTNGCCSAYAVRPVACRTYRCELLHDLESGEVTIERAAAIVHDTKGLIAEIHGQHGSHADGRTLPQTWDSQRGLLGTGPTRGANAAFALLAVTLDVMLHKYFLGPREQTTPPHRP